MEENVKISELLKEQIEKSEYPIVGAIFNNEYKNLDDMVARNGNIELISINSKKGMKIYRSTITYIMLKAFWHIDSLQQFAPTRKKKASFGQKVAPRRAMI